MVVVMSTMTRQPCETPAREQWELQYEQQQRDAYILQMGLDRTDEELAAEVRHAARRVTRPMRRSGRNR